MRSMSDGSLLASSVVTSVLPPDSCCRVSADEALSMVEGLLSALAASEGVLKAAEDGVRERRADSATFDDDRERWTPWRRTVGTCWRSGMARRVYERRTLRWLRASGSVSVSEHLKGVLGRHLQLMWWER